MAYVPPHKRNSKDKEKQPLSSPKVDDPSQNHRDYYRHKPSWQPPSKWFIVPSIDVNQHSLPLKIIKWEAQPREDMLIIVSDNVQKQNEATKSNPIIYVCNYLPRIDGHRNMEVYETANNSVDSPWRCIEKEIQRDLVSSFQNLRSEMYKSRSGLKVNPSFIVELGKNFFIGENIVDLESVNKLPFKTSLSDLYRRHSNRVPSSFTESIRTELVTNLGFKFHAEKEYYYVKVVDNNQPGYFRCKCTVNKAVGKLDLYKVGLYPKRHFILDISYLGKKLDPRLMLSAKRIFTTFSIANQSQCLSELMKSAIIDSKEKGGLRWSVEDNPLLSQYVIDKVRHTITEVFKSSTMKLKLRRKDECCLSASACGVDQSVILEMTEIERKLRDEAAELDPIIGMVKDTLMLLWEHFP